MSNKIGILGSTRGTNLIAIHDAIQQHTLDVTISVVISNKVDALILEKARGYGYAAEYISPAGLTREEYDERVSACLKHHNVSLVVLIGYMRILSGAFVRAWQNRIINIHPSLLPKHAGLMDLAVHQAVLDAGEELTGCTVHMVTEEVDAGPVIVQKSCPVFKEDSAVALKERAQRLEGDALVEAIHNITKAQ